MKTQSDLVICFQALVSKPTEKLSLPLWKDVDLVFKDVFSVSEELRDEAIHRYNVLEFLIERYGNNFSKKEIDYALPTLEEKFHYAFSKQHLAVLKSI
ncbi:TPA: hypothetical protein NJ097_000266 [Vibrio parahaemolyticus]|nr:hypothetical protein [Vibrio parahaemolyticus]HCG6087879.1 hypothetical protein [Vibrio parahaemolyticus]